MQKAILNNKPHPESILRLGKMLQTYQESVHEDQAQITTVLYSSQSYT